MLIKSPRLLFLPLAVLVVCLGLTCLSWKHEHQVVDNALRAQFDYALREIVGQIEQRALAYEQTLRGLQGLFASNSLMNRQAVRDYVHTLQLDANFSGIQTIGVIKKVLPHEIAGHIAEMRRLGLAGYQIHPEGDRDFYAPVVQREPESSASLAALGLDTWADPVRRTAMEKARDSGMPALTGKVKLAVDHGEEVKPGFIMYLPIYEQGKPRDSQIDRRKHLIGWVYAAFFMGDFMASLYGSRPDDLFLEIYDDADPVKAALMYRSSSTADTPQIAETALTAREYMLVAGHTWTLMLRTKEAFLDRFGRNSASVIAVTGGGMSLLLSLLVWAMISGRSRALQLAEEMTEELRQMAQHDPLTGLPNRALFSHRVHHELAFARRYEGYFAMIFLDLDNFKPINDNHGHAVGDRVLQEVARRLKETVRASDTVGRIGGDEFVVLIPELTKAELAVGLAEKIRLAVRQPYRIDGIELSLSCSLGVAVYPEDGMDEISLSKAADEAMYRAKANGRDGVQIASRNESVTAL
ncbi:CHASE domain-containing protein [Dechloromonas sp. ZS-1]|uniref:CHASE domain-containing protein n=1 Tax=Dechloromonas sp. ZS-1 TaxID=3138067 RepID=UPI0031FD43E4